MNRNKLSRPEKWILIGIPLLFVIGALLHFAYDVLGESPIVGLFAPVNESIWEHAKMVVWPIILWWGLYYRFRGEAYKINPNKWFAGALTSLLVALIAMPLIFRCKKQENTGCGLPERETQAGIFCFTES